MWGGGKNEYSFYKADDDEYVVELFQKLLEEAHEVVEEQDNIEKLVEELWDVLEVLYAIMDLKWLSFEKIEQIRNHKKNKKWGFSKKIILERVKK